MVNEKIPRENIEKRELEPKMQKESLKSQIIPEEWKEDIDEIVADELLSANRYFAKENPLISKLVDEEIKKPPGSFLGELRGRWNWHNDFYENKLEPALDTLLEKDSFELSLLQVKTLAGAYRASSLVDQATLVTSAAIKKYLDKWIPQLSEKFQLKDEEISLLTLPSQEPQWVEYYRDHLRYLLAEKEDIKLAEELKRKLLSKYHAGDEKIFNGRLAHQFSAYPLRDPALMEERIAQLKTDESKQAASAYLVMERPELKAIQDIVTFDNVEEYEIVKSLIGISGFILRKKTLQYLKESKILKRDGGIYEFSDEEIADGFKKLLDYRKEVLHKKVEGYRQTDDSCAAVSLMMALHYFGKSGLDKKTEDEMHGKMRSRIVPGSYFSRLALEARDNDLESILLHSEKDMFRPGKAFSGKLFEEVLRDYKLVAAEAESKGAKILNGEEINAQRIRAYLEDDYLIILAGKLGNEILHSVVICGYNPKGFMVNDPLSNNPKIWPERRVEEFSNTSIGQWMIALRKDYSAVNKLSASLSSFSEDAGRYLKIDVDNKQ